LSDDDLGPLYDLLIDEPPMVRRAIGELVYDHLIAQNIKTSHTSAIGTSFGTVLLIVAIHCYQTIF
jgi:cohesin complex subunit SA-1/2